MVWVVDSKKTSTNHCGLFFLWLLLKHLPHQNRDSQKPYFESINKNPPKKNTRINFKIFLELQTFQFVFNLYPLQSCNKCLHCPQQFPPQFPPPALGQRCLHGSSRGVKRPTCFLINLDGTSEVTLEVHQTSFKNLVDEPPLCLKEGESFYHGSSFFKWKPTMFQRLAF